MGLRGGGSTGERKVRVSLRMQLRDVAAEAGKEPRDWPHRPPPGSGWRGRRATFQHLVLASPACHWTHIHQHLLQWGHGAISSEDLAWGCPSLGDTDSPSPGESALEAPRCWRCPEGTQGLCVGAGSVATLPS